MKIINRSNFISTVCVVYTILSLYKVVVETILNRKMDSNQENFIWIMVISLLATFVLSLHYYLQKYPVGFVIIGQYMVLLAIISLCIWIEGHYVELHPKAYTDMFWSFTVPYIIGAAYYYISFWFKVMKANKIIKTLKSKDQINI